MLILPDLRPGSKTLPSACVGRYSVNPELWDPAPPGALERKGEDDIDLSSPWTPWRLSQCVLDSLEALTVRPVEDYYIPEGDEGKGERNLITIPV